MITAILKAAGTALTHASIAALVAVAAIRLWPPNSQDVQLRAWANKTDAQIDKTVKDFEGQLATVNDKIAAVQVTTGRQQQAIDSISLTNYERMRNDDTRQQLSYFQSQLNAHESRLTKHDALLEAHRQLIGIQRDRLDQVVQPSTTASVYWRY